MRCLHVSLCLLLVKIGVSALPAHDDNAIADAGKTVLHNDGVESQLSVVSNWTVICEHLCSLDLSGPSCGTCAVELPIGTFLLKDTPDFPLKHQAELCKVLCDNGLGDHQCECSAEQVKILSFRASGPSDRNIICNQFCIMNGMTLRGCSRCLYTRNFDAPSDKIYYQPPPPPFAQNIVWPGSAMTTTVPAVRNNADSQITTATDTTTPDWNRLCGQLCRQGQGGILCNCDLAPFF